MAEPITLRKGIFSDSSRNSENSVRAVLKEAAGKPNGELDAGRSVLEKQDCEKQDL